MNASESRVTHYAICALALALMTVTAGCGKPSGGGGEEARKPAYDPEQDPLVNVDSLFVPAPDDPSGIASDETLYLHLPGNPNTLVPIFMSTTADFLVADALYTGLFTFDKDMKWMVNDEVVESFEESEDHTTYTIRMKQGLTWQDGQRFTAQDVVYSWQEILDPRVPCPAVKQGTDNIKQCEALDDQTVRFTFDEPKATSRWDLSFPIIPKHIFEKDKENNPDLRAGDYYSALGRNPVGNGAYRLVEWRENDRLVFERWEDYKGTKPHFKRIVCRIVPDSNVSLLSFEKQDIDVIERLTAQQFAEETSGESFKKVGYKVWAPEWSVSYIGWNLDEKNNPFFHDKRVRKAMAHAMNVDLIIDKISYNLSVPSVGMFHPDSWMFNPNVERLAFDLDKAGALLDEAGWAVDASDGWRYKEIDGKRVRFVFTLTIVQGSSTAPRIAAIYQQDLKRIGVQMNTTTLEWAAFVVSNREHNFQAQMSGWGTGTDPQSNDNIFTTEAYENGRNYGKYSNPAVDELFDKAEVAFDYEERRAYFQEIHATLYDDQPYLWISHPPTLAAVNKRIQGIQTSPRGLFNFNPSYSGWWVAAGKARYAVAKP